MSDERIDSYVDRAAFGADTDFIEAELQRVTDSFNKVNSIKVTLQGANSLKDVSTAATQAQSGMADLTAATDRAVQKIAQYNGSSKEISQLILLEARASKELAAAKALEADATLKSAQAKAVEEKSIRDSQAAGGKDASIQKETTEAIQAQSKAQQDKTILQREADKAVFEGKLNQQLYNKELKDEVSLANTAEGSINNMRAAIKVLTADRNKLNLTTEEGRATNAEFNKQIDKLNDAITAGSAGLERRKINIGNYTGAVSILNDALISAKAKLDQMTASERTNSEAGQQLTKTVELLSTLAGQQAHGFTSLTQELRTSERALRTMFEAGLAGTPAFEELQTVVNDTTRRVREFGREQTLLSSESPALAGLTAAARGLGGAYAVGAGAAALFADGNEKVEKELQKLVAIMTFLQGLTEFNRFLQEKEAIAKSFNAVKTTFLAAAQNLAALATGKATAATQAQIIAETAALDPAAALAEAQTVIAATNEEIAATGGAAGEALADEAVGADGLAVGLGGVEAAEAGVAVGASTMATAIAATGIGLLIVGLAVVTYKIIEAIKDWNAENESLKKANEDVVKSLKDLIDATKAYDDLNRESTTRQLDNLSKLIEQRKALGVNALESLALDKKISDARIKATSEEVKLNDITAESIVKRNAEAVNAAGVVKAAEELKQQYIQKTGDKTKAVAEAQEFAQKIANGEVELTVDNAHKLAALGDKDYVKKIKQFDDIIKKSKEQEEVATALYKDDAEKFKAAEDAKAAGTTLANNTIKESDTELRKFRLDSIKLTAEFQTSLNDLVLNNDRSSLAQRLAAVKGNFAEQRKVINAENAAIQSDPDVSKDDKLIAAKKASNDLIILQKDRTEKIFKLNEDFRLRDLTAETEIRREILNVIIKNNEAIYNNDAITEQQRLDALKKSIDARKALLDNQFHTDLSTAGISDSDIEKIKQEGFFEIKNKKITNEELQKLIKAYTAGELDIYQQASITRLNIVKDYYQKEEEIRIKALKAVQREADLSNEDRSDTYNNDIVALNDSYNKGIISTRTYNEQRKKLDLKYSQDSLEIEKARLLKSLDENQKAVDVQKDLQAELISLQSVDQSGLADNQKKVIDDRIAKVKEELKAVQDAVGKETELYVALGKVIAKISDGNKRTISDANQNLLNELADIKEAANDMAGVVDGVFNAMEIAAKNRLKAEADAADISAQRQIDAINATATTATNTEEDKAAKITIINAKLAAQKANIDRQEKQAEIQKAKFEKATAIFNIILNTAAAVIKTLPGGLITGVTFAVAALGAAQLAVAIATPLPQFKHGKGVNDNYAGPAIWGDGGKREMKVSEDGKIEISPSTPTLTHVKAKDLIYPDADHVPFLTANVFRTHDRFIERAKGFNSTDKTSIDIASLEREIKSMKTTLAHAINNKKEIHIKPGYNSIMAIQQYGAQQIKYVHDNTQF